MHLQFSIIFCLFNVILSVRVCNSSEWKLPTVLISVLVRNKEHTLPYFLTLLERLDYPKKRITLYVSSDHNLDRSLEILETWIASVSTEYHAVQTFFDSNKQLFLDQKSASHWSVDRYRHVIGLREAALMYARRIWADYYWTLDADVFITNSQTLKYLIHKNVTIVAPMLTSTGLYSNFWHGMTSDYYYLRTDEYKPVLDRDVVGCFTVPMVHSSVLVDLRRRQSDLLTYRPEQLVNDVLPFDDIITFAVTARRNNISLYICNEVGFGNIMVPLEDDDLQVDLDQIINFKVDLITEKNPLHPLIVSELLQPFVKFKQPDTLDFDRIFVINLVRRIARRRRVLNCLHELGLKATVYEAVDGKALDDNTIKQLGFMPQFTDPYHNRPMTLGEIGCFLSHYNIWMQIVEGGYQLTLVLEDDIRFVPFFRTKVMTLMKELQTVADWDLVYLGRKRLEDEQEMRVPGTSHLVYAGYSYWTLAYIVSLEGARKLVDAKPLTKLVPVDEYLPILYDKHPQTEWKRYFPVRNLVALSASPLLIYPTHYTGEEGYISDTENSTIISVVTSQSVPINEEL